MARRIVGLPGECIVCLSIDAHNLSTLKRAFLRGYVSGLHMFSKGEGANERVCKEHAAEIDEAVAFYIGSGIDFPVAGPARLLTSSRVDVANDDDSERPSASLRAVSASGSRPPKPR